MQKRALYKNSGGGVEASDGSPVNVLGSGPGSGSGMVMQVPAGAVDGSNDTFTLNATVARVPITSANLLLFKDGLLQGPVHDYLLGNNQVVFVTPPTAGAKLLAVILSSNVTSSGSNSGGSGTAAPGAFGSNSFWENAAGYPNDTLEALIALDRGPTLPIHYFATEAELYACLAAAVPNDAIIYNPVDPYQDLVINSQFTGFIDFNVSSDPAHAVYVDLGWASNYPTWRGTSGDFLGMGHVVFNYTGADDEAAVPIRNSKNLGISGGEVRTNGDGGPGVLIEGPIDHVHWDNMYVHDTGSHGVAVMPNTHAGVASTIKALYLRGVVADWGKDLSYDTSSEPGTDLHAVLIDASTADSEVFQDALLQFYVNAGYAGNAMEIRSSRSTTIFTNIWVALLAIDLNFVSTSLVASNALHLSGDSDIDATIMWVEGSNLQGRVVDGEGVTVSGAIGSIVSHGRHLNTNQNPNLATIEPALAPAEPYDGRWGIVYEDNI